MRSGVPSRTGAKRIARDAAIREMALHTGMTEIVFTFRFSFFSLSIEEKCDMRQVKNANWWAGILYGIQRKIPGEY